MNERILLWIEFTGRAIITVAILFVVLNISGKVYAALSCIPMILWMINPILEYKFYGGS